MMAKSDNILTRSRLYRLWQIRRVIKKYGLASLIDDLSLSKKAKFGARCLFGSAKKFDPETRGQRIRQALEELGPVFVKLGQTLSTRPDLLSADIADELVKLQDEVPAFSSEKAMALIRECYGETFNDIFAYVEPEPIASASVAQVHAATLNEGHAIVGKDGQSHNEVIIKIIRPNIEKIIKSDLQVMYMFASVLQKHWSRGKQMKPLEVIKEYDTTINDELDLRREAANCVQMGTNFLETDIIYVPQIYWDYTHTNILVMERIYGTSIRETQLLKEKGYNLEQLASDGVEVFFKQAFEDNFFHADMHPGNIFVSDKGKWIAIDFGIMGTLTDEDKQYLADNLLGFFNRDYNAIARAHYRAGWVSADTRIEEFEAAIRTVCEPIFAKPISEISFGNVLMQLFNTARRFEIPIQPQLVLLYKTLLNIEGLGRQLYPDLNLWDTAKPFLESWMKQQIDPRNFLKQIKRDLPKWRAIIPLIPDILTHNIEQSSPAYQAQQTLKLEQRLADERQKKQITLFHQIFGFGIAIISLTLFLLCENSLIKSSTMTVLSPFTTVVGVFWAYYFSRK